MSASMWQVLNVANSGLQSSEVMSIAEDKQGNLWFGTYGGGLSRLSPEGHWRSYLAADGALANDYVGYVATDPAGSCVWAVCDRIKDDPVDPGGVCCLTPDGELLHRLPLPEGCIVAAEVDRRGALWTLAGGYAVGVRLPCRTMRVGSMRCLGGTWSAFDGTATATYGSHREALEAWYPHRPERTRLPWRMIGTTALLLDAISTAAPPPVPPSTEGLSPLMQRMMESMAAVSMMPGIGSFLSEYVLMAYDGRTWSRKTEVLQGWRFGDLEVDAGDRIWVSLESLGDVVMPGGISLLDGPAGATEWRRFTREDGLIADSVAGAAADRHGGIWVSHGEFGVGHWDGERWQSLVAGSDGLPDTAYGVPFVDRQDHVWFPTPVGAVTFSG